MSASKKMEKSVDIIFKIRYYSINQILEFAENR